MNRREIMSSALIGGALAGLATQSVTVAAAQAAQSGASIARIKQAGVLRMAAIPGQEPYFHKDLVSGEWSGACIEMARDITRVLDVKLDIVESTWGNQILDLQAGKIDLAFAVNPTPERSLAIDFSTPIFVHSFMVISNKDFKAPETWAEIDKPEVRIAVDAGSTHELIARRYCPNAEILNFKTRDEAIMAVQTGRAHCNVSLTVNAISTMKKNPTLGSLALPKPVLTLPTNCGVRKEEDKAFRDFISIWSDYNRSIGQTSEWMMAGFAALGVTKADLPADLTF